MAYLSIIIPVYNVEKYIRRCIEGIYAQNYNDVEIILVDDGSKDSSGIICDALAQKDNRIKVIHKENGGCSEARNVGISAATGKYICFIDSDDEWFPGTLNKLLEKNNQEYDMVIYGAKTVTSDGELLGYERTKEEKSYNDLIEVKDFLVNLKPEDRSWGLNYIWNRLYKANIIKDNNITFDTSINLGEDFVFNCEVMKHISSLKVVDDMLYCYYKYFQNQLTMRFREDELKRRDFIFETHKNLYLHHGIYEVYKKNCYIEEGLLTHYGIMKTAYVDCKLNFKETVDYVKSFFQSVHYEALLEFLNYDNKSVKLVVRKLYKMKNSYLLAIVMMILRKKNALKK